MNGDDDGVRDSDIQHRVELPRGMPAYMSKQETEFRIIAGMPFRLKIPRSFKLYIGEAIYRGWYHKREGKEVRVVHQ